MTFLCHNMSRDGSLTLASSGRWSSRNIGRSCLRVTQFIKRFRCLSGLLPQAIKSPDGLLDRLIEFSPARASFRLLDEQLTKTVFLGLDLLIDPSEFSFSLSLDRDTVILFS